MVCYYNTRNNINLKHCTMATIKVTKRVYNQSTGFFEYHKVDGDFKTYKEVIEHFKGEQDWYDKKYHRFKANGDLYTMKKVTE